MTNSSSMSGAVDDDAGDGNDSGRHGVDNDGDEDMSDGFQFRFRRSATLSKRQRQINISQMSFA